MKRLTLYTGVTGFSLFEDKISFWASNKKLYDTDLKFTVDEDDAEIVKDHDEDCDIYDVVTMDSVEWDGDNDDA